MTKMIMSKPYQLVLCSASFLFILLSSSFIGAEVKIVNGHLDHNTTADPTTTEHALEKAPNFDDLVQRRGFVLTEEITGTVKHLNIAVPNKTGFREFVRWSLVSEDQRSFDGYCIEVFRQALKELNYKVNCTFFLYEDGDLTPVYNDMITGLSQEKYDALVGDFTIRSKRLEKVDFTQPYSESGIVVVVPVKEDHFSETWAFLRPFTVSMWIATGVFFVCTGIVVWILEHKGNSHFRGPPREQATTIFWFIHSTMFFVHRQNIKGILGRVVVIVWLFVVLVIVRSYSASLTSIVTVKKFSPSIDDIEGLLSGPFRIGYQTGSFVKDYLIEERNIPKERLVSLSKVEDYANALHLGPGHPNGVAAIIDELPYVQLFLSRECGFAITGQQLTRAGFGYAFPKESQIGKDLSVAILRLSESGRLQNIHDSWLSMEECSSELNSNSLGLTSFKGLFLTTGVISGVCMLIFFLRSMVRFQANYRISISLDQLHAEDQSSKSLKVLKSFASYMDGITPPREQGSNRMRSQSESLTPGLSLQTQSSEGSNGIGHLKQSSDDDTSDDNC